MSLFLLVLAHNSLPLKLNIKRKGLKLDTWCPICWRLDEDAGHCFLKCKHVKQCWLDLSLEMIHQKLSFSSSVTHGK